jgi:hypothetical protein
VQGFTSLFFEMGKMWYVPFQSFGIGAAYFQTHHLFKNPQLQSLDWLKGKTTGNIRKP